MLFQSGCEQQISERNLHVINRLYESAEKNGRAVSKKEVESILGQPASVETFPMERPAVKEYKGERYIYEQDGQKLILHFVDGNLSQKASAFGTKEPLTPDEVRAPFHRKPATAENKPAVAASN